jgi:hypothetical protein
LDAVSAWETGAHDDTNSSAMNTALDRLNEVDGAIQATMTDDDGMTLDVSNLLGGAIVTLNWLVERLADARGITRTDVLVELRDFLDA